MKCLNGKVFAQHKARKPRLYFLAIGFLAIGFLAIGLWGEACDELHRGWFAVVKTSEEYSPLVGQLLIAEPLWFIPRDS